MTVPGPIEPDALGITLTHEHLLSDLRVWCKEPEDEEQQAFMPAPHDSVITITFARKRARPRP